VRTLLLKFGKYDVAFTKGVGGVFEIRKSEKLVFSKQILGRFPLEEEVRAIAGQE
jgi:predicted Rdx family selenoprotein